MSTTPTLYINDRLSASLAQHRKPSQPSWWVPWCKELEEKLATTLHELEQAKAEVERLKNLNTHP